MTLAALATKADLAITKAELQRGIAETKVEILKWMLYLALVIQAVTIVSVVIALLHSSGR